MKQSFLIIWKKWKGLSRIAMEFQAKIILGILYFTLLVPIGLWFRTTHDILRRKSLTTNWQSWPHLNADREIRKM